MPSNSTDSRAFADETERKFQLTGCKISRSQLNKIVQTLVFEFPPRAVTVSSTRHGTRISRASLDELLTAISRSRLPGDPLKIDNVKVCVHSRTRSASLSIDALSLTGRLYGTDTDWVLSCTQELTDLVQETRPRRVVAKTAARPNLVAFATGGFLVGSLTPVLAALADMFASPAGPVARLALATSCGILGAVLATVGARWYVRRSSVQLLLDEGHDRGRHLSASDYVAIATASAIVAVTAIGIAVNHHDSTHPHTSTVKGVE